MFQLLPSLITVTVALELESNSDVFPSIVWDDVVASVTTGIGVVELIFFIVYILPAQALAFGSVTVAAEAPVNSKV